jgi:hypothetical protein
MNALEPVNPIHSVAKANGPRIDIDALINKAVDAKSAVEVIKELREMWAQDRALAAEEAFNESMSAFQAACPVIHKEKGVPTKSGKIAYKYAPIEAIEVQIRPVERDHGFNHTFDTDVASEKGWVIAKCCITHRQGHSKTSTAKFPLGTKTEIMSETQVYAAALTFANRRALCNAYGLILAGEDLDGATGKLKPTGPSSMRPEDTSLKGLAQELWDVLKTVRGDKKDWVAANQWLWREDILDGALPEEAPNLTAEKFRKTIDAARAVLGV